MPMSIAKSVLVAVALVFAVPLFPANAQESTEPDQTSQEAAAVITQYHNAVNSADVDALLAVLGPQVSMFNGAGSSNPADWRPHLFLSGAEVAEWAQFFVQQSGPHTGSSSIIQATMHQNQGLVITQETGSNKFWSWENQQRVWLLGQTKDGLKIVGIFYPEAGAAPE